MGGLAVGVDAGIGAARTVRSDFFFCHIGNGFGEEILDGVATSLRLPALEWAAIVCDGQFENRCGGSHGNRESFHAR